jgi:hypothetical protein
MEQKRHAGGGTDQTQPCGCGPLILCGKHGWRGDGPVARAEERRLREQEAQHSAASWLSDGLSRGFAGTRIA